MAEQQNNEQQQELTELEIAELANKEIKTRDAEIAKLKKELAQAKLYSTAEEEEVKPMTKQECLDRLSDSHISNYDYAEAVVNLADIEVSEGRPNPLGKNGEEVCSFLKDVIEECDGDKSRFPAIYQAKLGPDNPSDAMAYNKRKKQ